jgi:hypothetical protein
MTSGIAPGRRAAERLLYDKESIARAVTATLYEEHPELIDKHGERGREKTLQDMHYNIEHLVSSLDLEDPSLIVSYARWLTDVLRARTVDPVYVVRCWELVADEARRRYAEDEAAAVAATLDAAIRESRRPV